MTTREVEVIFNGGQVFEDLLCEAVYSVLHPESSSDENDAPDSGVSTSAA